MKKVEVAILHYRGTQAQGFSAGFYTVVSTMARSTVRRGRFVCKVRKSRRRPRDVEVATLSGTTYALSNIGPLEEHRGSGIHPFKNKTYPGLLVTAHLLNRTRESGPPELVTRRY